MKIAKNNIPNTNSEQACSASDPVESEKTDEQGNRWVRVYSGSGKHFENWLDQCRELGEVMVEERSGKGLRCFENESEKLFTIWMKMDPVHDRFIKNEKT